MITENSKSNYELCAVALQCISLLCYNSRGMRLEVTKIGVFDTVL